MANKKKLSQRQQQALAQQARQRQRLYLGIGGVVVALILIGGGIFLFNSKSAASSAASVSNVGGVTVACSDIQTLPDEGRLHIAAGETPVYRQNPPTSGSHNPNPMPAGIYDNPIDVTREVHSLEHGYIVIHYNGVPTSAVDQLKNIAGADQRKVILSPYSTMPFKISLTAWDHRQTCDGVNPQVINAFISEFRDQGPENAP